LETAIETPRGRQEKGLNPRAEILVYALAVLGISTGIVACFSFFHITDNWAANALMFVPGATAAAFLLRSRQGFRSIGWGFGKLRYWLWAIFLPVTVLAIVLPVSIRLGYAAMAPASAPISRIANHPWKILENIILYTAISLPFAFGEEFGWRGFAQGRLTREFGLIRGLLLLGLIWGFWHTPIYYETGEFPTHPIFGSFVMTPIDNILAVVPMAWFYLKSKNIWVPTLAHAFADVLWGFSDLLYPKSHEIQSWAILQGAQLVVSVVLLNDLRSDQQKESAVTETPGD